MRGFAFAVAAAGLALCCAPAAAQADDTVWLCKPGVSPNPCLGSLETTYIEPDGRSRVENPPNARNPKVDCFYVYPTVSDQKSANSDRTIEPEQVAIARYQAARFSEKCRLYAPMYRQRTIAAIFAPPDTNARALAIAYEDIKAAWREYLARDNRGRGVVLIGHSQGTRMLRQLIKEEIDPQPSVRRKLISAVLLGGNVLVREREGSGGDFQNVPACTAGDQVGCVIAYSAFNETPPPRARFGRYEPAAGEPTGLEVLCTNPAELSGDRGALETLTRTEDFPGTIGLGLQLLFAGMPPDADTPWVQPQDHFTGRCVREAGANVLRVDAVGSARQPTPSPDPTWGLHLVDVNIAMGNLVTIVGRQGEAYLKRACLGRAALTRLGSSRAADRRRLTGRRPSGRAGIDRYCVAGGGSLRFGYPTGRSPAGVRGSILVLSNSRRVALAGVRPGDRVRKLRRRLGGERRFRVGRSVWFVARARRAALVFRVSGDRVAAVGLGRLSLNRTAAGTRRFLRTWQRG